MTLAEARKVLDGILRRATRRQALGSYDVAEIARVCGALKSAPGVPAIAYPCGVCDRWDGCRDLDRCGLVKHLDDLHGLLTRGQVHQAVGQVETIRAAVMRQTIRGDDGGD
jgi:hypothetical protein